VSTRSHSIDPGVTSHRASPATTRHSHARLAGDGRRHLGLFPAGFRVFGVSAGRFIARACAPTAIRAAT
jgi:hypothetical protein